MAVYNVSLDLLVTSYESSKLSDTQRANLNRMIDLRKEELARFSAPSVPVEIEVDGLLHTRAIGSFIMAARAMGMKEYPIVFVNKEDEELWRSCQLK